MRSYTIGYYERSDKGAVKAHKMVFRAISAVYRCMHQLRIFCFWEARQRANAV